MSEINILYGPPGSGKTTAANLLPSEVTYLSVGRLARREIERKTILGCLMDNHIQNLQEYPKPIIRQLVEKPIELARGVILLDGFPKYERETEVLEEIMESNSLLPGKLFNIELDPQEAWDRVSGRRVCLSCDYQSDGDVSCPCCGESLKKRPDDNYNDFVIRYGDYEKNNNIVRLRLIKLGYKAIKLANGTAKEYCDIISDSLLKHARVAQQRERLVRFQEVDS